MDIFTRLTDFFKTIWKQTTPGAKIGLIGALVVCAAMIAGVGYWSAQPYYVPLTENIGAQKAAEVKEKLDSVGIKNKLSYAGNAVLVDQSDFSNATVAIAEIVGDSDIAQNDTWGIGGNSNSDQQTRQREQMLSKKLEQLKPVQHASVTLAIPETSPFLRDQTEPTASVLVSLADRYTLTRSLAQAVANVVAGGVEGLRVENVKVFDEHGNFRTVQGDDSGVMLSDQNEMRRAEEMSLTDKAMRQLEGVLGPGMAKVSITAEMDFERSSIENLTYDGDQKLKDSETVSTKEVTLSGGASGAAGTATNLIVNANQNNGNRNQIEKTEDLDTTFIYGQQVEKTEKPGGEIKRISVSVVAELPTPEPAAEGADPPPPVDPVAMQAELEKIVKIAVGFDESRGDQFELLLTKLNGKDTFADMWSEPAATIPPYLNDIIRSSSLVLASLVALGLGFMMIKRIQPRVINQVQDSPITPERARRISDMSSLIRDNPELLSRILASWVDVPSSAGDSTTAAEKRAA